MSGNRRFDTLGPLDSLAVLAMATGIAVMRRTWGWWKR